MTGLLKDQGRHHVIGAVRVTERLQFAGAVRGTWEWLEAGEVLPVLAPDDSEQKDMHTRAKNDRPPMVVVLWKDRRRMVPVAAVERGQR